MLKAMIFSAVLVLTATATLAAPGDDRGGPQGMVAMVAMHHQGNNPSGEGGP